jgi:predicted adenine nucleotide alpha hydrolase (AANH) superfamily ATPase
LKLLLHICCAPCSIYPVSVLQDKGVETTGFFFNPNIHPLTEYRKRLSALEDYASTIDLSLIVRDQYLLKEFLRDTVFREEDRCRVCYRMRLTAAAEEAKGLGMDAFSTTLLYSVYQKHEEIIKAGEDAAREQGVSFYYEDFRVGWKEGAKRSKEMGIYRQQYCGCVYSEMERYLGKDSPRRTQRAQRKKFVLNS